MLALLVAALIVVHHQLGSALPVSASTAVVEAATPTMLAFTYPSALPTLTLASESAPEPPQNLSIFSHSTPSSEEEKPRSWMPSVTYTIICYDLVAGFAFVGCWWCGCFWWWWSKESAGMVEERRRRRWEGRRGRVEGDIRGEMRRLGMM